MIWTFLMTKVINIYLQHRKTRGRKAAIGSKSVFDLLNVYKIIIREKVNVKQAKAQKKLQKASEVKTRVYLGIIGCK